MLCFKCQKNEASVYINSVVNNKSFKINLCLSCAEANGLALPSTKMGLPGSLFEIPSINPLFQNLNQLLSHGSKSLVSPSKTSPCPFCAWTWGEFQKTGFLGCPTCYTHFQKDLKTILKKIHGTALHKKDTHKQSLTSTSLVNEKSKLQDLKKNLDKALAEERYEDAALLRDQIRLLEKKSS